MERGWRAPLLEGLVLGQLRRLLPRLLPAAAAGHARLGGPCVPSWAAASGDAEPARALGSRQRELPASGDAEPELELEFGEEGVRDSTTLSVSRPLYEMLRLIEELCAVLQPNP